MNGLKERGMFFRFYGTPQAVIDEFIALVDSKYSLSEHKQVAMTQSQNMFVTTTNNVEVDVVFETAEIREQFLEDATMRKAYQAAASPAQVEVEIIQVKPGDSAFVL